MYNKNNPFLATIKLRYPLTGIGSDKKTFHLVLDLKDSGLTYRVGDSIAIQPVNSSEVVSKTLQALQAEGFEIVTDKEGEVSYSLFEYFMKKCNLRTISKKLMGEICARQTNFTKKQHLELLLSEGEKEQLKKYLEVHQVWDVLIENPEAVFTPQEFCKFLMPLLPRFYSIASSMLNVGEEVHLTVVELAYEAKGSERLGACTHFLCKLSAMEQAVVPVYIQPTQTFTLPIDDAAPVIMVGPGTGVAPFRAFMQEREFRKAKGKNWLFFGERTEAEHFFYKEYWHELVDHGSLRLTTAFSRDQAHKVYVQHRLHEFGQEIFEWLEQGAYFYVCGDAQRMAKDVDMALHQLVQKYGHHDEQSAKEYVKKLKKEGRYLRDVY